MRPAGNKGKENTARNGRCSMRVCLINSCRSFKLMHRHLDMLSLQLNISLEFHSIGRSLLGGGDLLC